MTYSWKFYLLVAHLVDEHGHTACNRQLPQTDEPLGNFFDAMKCKTCLKFIVKEGNGEKQA